MIKALVLHTHVAGLGVIRALGRIGVPVVAFHYEDREMGYASKYVTDRVRMPDIETDESGFVQKLIDLADGYKGGILIPTNDFTISTVARHRSRPADSHLDSR